MDLEPPGPRVAEGLLHPVEDRGIIGLGSDAAQRPGVEVAEVDAGGDAPVHTAQGQHFVQCAQLADLAHRLRAEGDVRKACFVQRGLCPAQGVQRLFQCSLPALPAAAAGVEDDPLPAQRLADRRALQQIVHAVQPLVLFQAGHADIIRRVDAEQDVLRRRIGGHLPGLVQPQPDAAPALVLKGVQPHPGRVGRDIQAGFVALRCKAVARARRAEPDLPLPHRVFPPRS